MDISKVKGRTLAEMVTKTYGSFSSASRKTGIHYERIRKAIDRSRISREDLERLFPECPAIDELADALKLTVYAARARSDESVGAGVNDKESRFERSATELIKTGLRVPQIHIASIKALKDTYALAGDGDAVVVFFETSKLPTEWLPTNSELFPSVAAALEKNASIFYVTNIESMEAFTDLKKRFKRFSSFLAGSGRNGNNLFLIGSRNCEFCVPFQSRLLLGVVENDHRIGRAMTMLHNARLSTNSDRAPVVLPSDTEETTALIMTVFDIIWTDFKSVESDRGAIDRADASATLFDLGAVYAPRMSNLSAKQTLSKAAAAFHRAFAKIGNAIIPNT